jgi:hypothetical protein
MPDTNEQQQQLNVQQQQPAPDNERCALQLHSLRPSRLQLQMCSQHTATFLAVPSSCVLGHSCWAIAATSGSAWQTYLLPAFCSCLQLGDCSGGALPSSHAQGHMVRTCRMQQ